MSYKRNTHVRVWLLLAAVCLLGSLLQTPTAAAQSALPDREAAARQLTKEYPPRNATGLVPTNDTFDSAEILTGTTGAIGGTNVGATIELGEPVSCAECATVWYKWTAPANLSMTFETYGGLLGDTMLDIYMGDIVTSLKLLALNDNASPINKRSRVTFVATSGATYMIRIYGRDGSMGNFNLRWEINGAESWKQFNFDGAAGSRASDYGIFRLQAGTWWIYESLTGKTTVQKWGVVTDYLVPGDYDGDGNDDFAVWRPNIEPRPGDPPPGFWVLKTSDYTFFMQPWGVTTDRPAPGDFDGDDLADMALWRPSTGTFWWIRSSDYTGAAFQWGATGDFTATADYDGDGRTDFAIQRNANGEKVVWIMMSGSQQAVAIPFGVHNDRLVPGDYDNDGKADICVHRYTNDTFYWLRSSDGQVGTVTLGVWGDELVAGDYSQNYGSDITVWRPSEGNFYTYDPMDASLTVFHWGKQGDAPIGRSTVR